MNDRDKARKNRSRNDSRSKEGSRGRYYDTFYDDLQIADDQESSPFSYRLNGEESDRQSHIRLGLGHASTDGRPIRSERRATRKDFSAAKSSLAARVPAVIKIPPKKSVPRRASDNSSASTEVEEKISGEKTRVEQDIVEQTSVDGSRSTRVINASQASNKLDQSQKTTRASSMSSDRMRDSSSSGRSKNAHVDSQLQDVNPAFQRAIRGKKKPSSVTFSSNDSTSRESSQASAAPTKQNTTTASSANEGSSGRQNTRQSRNRKASWAIRFVVAITAAAVFFGAGVALAYYNGVATNFRTGVDQELLDVLVETDIANEPFYMLLLGTDGSAERDTYEDLGGSYRSDSMILARVDAPAQKITLVTIPRDIPVDLGEFGEQKINAAYTFGGPALAVKEVSKLAGVPISHYAQVDFDGFSSMVDAVGGVNVIVPMYIDDPDAGGTLQAGEQTLNGQQALILCRARHAYDEYGDGDMMRTANQRSVIASIVESALAADIGTIARTVRAASDYVTTDLEMNDIIGLAQSFRGIDTVKNMYTASAPSTSSYENGGWYEYLDEAEWKEMMQRVDAGEPPVKESLIDRLTGVVLATAGDASIDASEKHCTVTVKNATGTKGLDEKIQSVLLDSGYVNAQVGSVSSKYSYPETMVVYDDEGRKGEAEAILDVVGQGEIHYDSAGEYAMDYTDFIVILGKDWN